MPLFLLRPVSGTKGPVRVPLVAFCRPLTLCWGLDHDIPGDQHHPLAPAGATTSRRPRRAQRRRPQPAAAARTPWFFPTCTPLTLTYLHPVVFFVTILLLPRQHQRRQHQRRPGQRRLGDEPLLAWPGPAPRRGRSTSSSSRRASVATTSARTPPSRRRRWPSTTSTWSPTT